MTGFDGASSGAPAAEAGDTRGRGSLGLLLAAVLLAYTAQQLLTPVFPPLSREVGLSEVELGLVVTLAAAALTVAGPWWGRACDRIGYRRVMIRGLLISAAGLAAFAAISTVALGGGATPGVTLAVMIAARSAVFGVGAAAVPVAALAYVSSISTTTGRRTALVGRVGAMQGASLLLGPAIGGALATVELLLPLYLAPALLLGVVVLLTLRRPAGALARVDASPSSLRFADPRIGPYLAVGFLAMLSLGLVQVIMGFLYQDRLGLDAQRTAGAVGAAGFLIGIVLVLAQAVLVPRLRWRPRRLLIAGPAVAVVGYLTTAAAGSFWSLTAGLMLVGLGLGLTMPGYNAGATLAVEAADQGRVAGYLTAVLGATFVVGPILGTSLYRSDDRLPLWVAAGLCVLALALASVLRTLRRPGADTMP